MRTADGVPDGTSFSSTSFSSTAEALRSGAALADYLNSPAGARLEAAAPGAALASIGEIQSKLADGCAGLLPRFDFHDADGSASSCACLAAPGQSGPA
jgi:hypothetical protein